MSVPARVSYAVGKIVAKLEAALETELAAPGGVVTALTPAHLPSMIALAIKTAENLLAGVPGSAKKEAVLAALKFVTDKLAPAHPIIAEMLNLAVPGIIDLVVLASNGGLGINVATATSCCSAKK